MREQVAGVVGRPAAAGTVHVDDAHDMTLLDEQLRVVEVAVHAAFGDGPVEDAGELRVDAAPLVGQVRLQERAVAARVPPGVAGGQGQVEPGEAAQQVGHLLGRW